MTEMIFLQVLDMSRTAGWCILGVLLVRVFLRRAPRKYLYGLWAVVAFRLICPVSVETAFSVFNLDRGQPHMVLEETGTEALETAEASELFVEEVFLAGEGKQIPAAAGWEDVWLLGMAALLIYFMAGLWRVKGRVRMAVRIGVLSGTGEEASWRKGGPEVYECENIGSPFVLGMLRPRIYLPWGLSGEARRMVLLHEQYHIQRKDHLVKYAAFVLLSVYWFHPLVWAAWVCMGRDMEMSCDEKVLERLGDGSGRGYSQTLLSLAARGTLLSGQAAGFGEQDVKRRIRHALHFQKPAVWAGAAAFAAVAAAVLLLGTDGKETPLGQGTMGEQLYEAKNLYIGDVSAEGRLIGKIYEALPGNLAAETGFQTELQTSREPYEFHFRMQEGQERAPEEEEMEAVAVLMLALTDNLGVVRWTLVNPEGEPFLEGILDTEKASELLGVEDIKEFGSSPEHVERLLSILQQIE